MDLFPNRLFCPRCHSPRSISEYPFGPDRLRLTTCIYCQFRRKQQAEEKLLQHPPQRIPHLPEQVHQPQQTTRYCSSCNQPRQPSQFSQFKTCDLCRSTNKKSQRRRSQKGYLHNQQLSQRRPLQELAETHLRQWVQRSGEEEVIITSQISKGWGSRLLNPRRPLTIDDYFQEEEPEQLRKRWLERQR